jgi:hypothetical protein
MNRTLLLSLAVVAAFAGTTLYLQKQKPSDAEQPTPTSERPQRREAAASGPRSFASARVATGYHDAPKKGSRAESEPVETTEPPPDDDSVLERQQLYDYVGGLKNVDPVSPEQQRAILESKLRHKKVYEAAVRDSGIDHETLTPVERAYAHKAIAAALQEYKDGYLQDVQPVLSDEQFTLLSNYETTEFNRELERLQIMINEK